jgi:hypothetical protein
MTTKSCRDFGYQPDDHWPKLPAGWSRIEVVGVVTDSLDCVLLLSRGDHQLTIFDCYGTFLVSQGEGLFPRPHGPL